MENRRDILLIVMINRNIGNNLTNYALYRYLTDCGHRVQVFSEPIDSPMGKWLFERHDENLAVTLPFQGKDLHSYPSNKWEIYEAAHAAELCIVGSDQIWRDRFAKAMSYHSLLAWLPGHIKKISYGASFGVDYFEGDVLVKSTYAALLRRFTGVSVREKTGRAILKEEFNVNAEIVSDPVFLPNKNVFDDIADQGNLTRSKAYIGVYLLDIDDHKENIVLSSAESLTAGEYVAYSDSERMEYTACNLEYDMDSLCVANWLRMIKNAAYVITDSFHGVCFCLIYQKQFIAVQSKSSWRGKIRIKELLDEFGILERLVEPSDTWNIDAWQKRIDYRLIEKRIFEAREKSVQWINSMFTKKTIVMNHNYYDKYLVKDYKQYIKVRNRRKGIGKHIVNEYARENGVKGSPELVGWGAGKCFWNNIMKILEYVEMKRLYEKDQSKWGYVNIHDGISILDSRNAERFTDVIIIVFSYDACSTLEIMRDIQNKGAKGIVHASDFVKRLERSEELEEYAV